MLYNTIYALLDPFNGDVKYIGQTVNIEQRIKMSNYKGCTIESWLIALEKRQAKPEVLILDTVERGYHYWWESFYIQLYKSYGFKLLNTTCTMKNKTKPFKTPRMTVREFLERKKLLETNP